MSSSETLRVNPLLLRELQQVITRSMHDTFQALFNIDLSTQPFVTPQHMSDLYLCKAQLSNAQGEIALCFSIDHWLMESVLVSVYPPELLEDSQVIEDAVSEIVNIVGNRAKAYLNEHGYQLKLALPYAAKAHQLSALDLHHLLHFTIHPQHVLVDIFSKKQCA